MGTSHSQHHAFLGPWVTSVGGTTGGDKESDDKKSENPEVAASLSGGGFSNYFVRPEYQAKVVPAFLQNIHDMYDGFYKFVHCRCSSWPILTLYLCSPNGRGIPDISAQAVNFWYVRNMQFTLRSGTSGSTPVRLPLLPPLCVVHPRAPS